MPAGIKFACPHCGRACKVPFELAGKQGRCPGCRRGLEVPHPDSSKVNPALPSSPSQSARSPIKSLSGRSTKRSKATVPSAEGFVHPDSIVPDSVIAERAGLPVDDSDDGADDDPLEAAASAADAVISGAGEIDAEEEGDHKTTTELQGLGKAECPACSMEIDANLTTCPFCKVDLRPKDGVIPWQVWVSLICFIPAPLPGLVIAQWGLRVSRRRRANELPAWVSVFLNGVFLVFGTLYMLRKAIMA